MPLTALKAAATCHGTAPCLLPRMPFRRANRPRPRNWLKTSLSRFSAVERDCAVDVQLMLVELLSVLPCMPMPPGLTPSPVAGELKGLDPARVPPIAPTQRMLIPMTIGPRPISEGWLGDVAAQLSPRLTRRPLMSAGRYSTAEFEL